MSGSIGPDHVVAVVVGTLLRAGAVADARDGRGRTPLHGAARWGSLAAAAALLGSPPAGHAGAGRAPTAAAAASWAAPSRRTVDANAADAERQTPLHGAALEGHPRMVALLVDHGADVDAAGRDGQTPLHAAALEGQQHAVKALLECGAATAPVNGAGDTPLATAVALGRADIFAQLSAEHAAEASGTRAAREAAAAGRPGTRGAP